MTICWHFNDLKISHVNPKAVDKIVNWLDKLYLGATAKGEKIHDYLGMTFDFYTPYKVNVSMDDCIDKVSTGFPALKLHQVQQGITCSKCVMKTSERYFQRSEVQYIITLFLYSFYLQHPSRTRHTD